MTLIAQDRSAHEKAMSTMPPGVQALTRLLRIARNHSGQCRVVAEFLLSLYNGNRFKFDLTDFRLLDTAIFNDCIEVMKMDHCPVREVHTYFVNGGAIWEDLAKQWRICDYTKRERA